MRHVRDLVGGRLAALPRLVVVILVGLVLAGCDSNDSGGGATPATPATISTVVASPRQPPSQIDAPVGDVRVEEGPFTDRVELRGLSFAAATRPVVRGRIRNSIDVSDLIVLEIQADFYDRRGRFLSSGRQVFEEAVAPPDGPFLRFTIRPERPEPGATAAVVSIPQLVNE